MSKRTSSAKGINSSKKGLSGNRSADNKNSDPIGDGPTHQGQRSGNKSMKGKSHQASGAAISQEKGTSQSKTPRRKHASGKPKSGKDTACTNAPAFQQQQLTMEEIEAGLKSGRFIQGELRVNARDYKHSYLSHPDGGSDVLIEGLELRKPALSGDLVAVEIIKGFEQETEKPDSIKQLESVCQALDINTDKYVVASSLAGEGSDSETPDVIIEEDQTTMITPGTPKGSDVSVKDTSATSSSPQKKVHRMGKVVTVLKRKHNRICSGHIKKNKTGDRVLFSPNDSRVPRILVSRESCPQDFLKRPDDYKNVLYAARILDWPPGSMFAEGVLIREIGQDGQMDTMIEATLLENNVDTSDFSPNDLGSLTVNVPWQIPKTEIAKRRDFRSMCVFTIDPSTARDLDDALSIEELPDGTFDVGVHIADVTYFLHEETPLDGTAGKRATSVYLPNKVIPMLPRVLCEDLCSLNPDQDRLAFSVVWNISAEGQISKEWFGKSVIRSCVKLSYQHAQGFIDDPHKNWTAEELPPISSPFSVAQIKEKVLDLNKVAVNLRKKRKEDGALNLNQVKLSFNLDDKTGMPNGYHTHEQLDSNRLVEEFMLLANMAVAHKINRCLPEQAMLRRHPEPNSSMALELEKQSQILGVPLDFTNSGSLQKSLDDICREDLHSRGKLQVLLAMCSKPMQMAVYFCNGCLKDEMMYRHYALSVPLYTHFTSPIRRYADVLVHRALSAALGDTQMQLGKDKIQELADNCNVRKKAAKVVSDTCEELFFSAFVQEVGTVEGAAMVLSVLDHCVDVYFLNLGLTKRVYIDQLPLKVATYVDGKLILVWKKVEGVKEEMTQCLSIFTKIHCSITKGNYPLTWMATLQRPEEDDSVKSE
ncbi:DIS3-like exonuclease 2 isoform X2 [Mizuhopecten yessoensis]|nr:DIS3-like exonuclease 2 isoform X2 [Mizuhopecten yessoensis]